MESFFKKNYQRIAAGILTLFFIVSAFNAWNDSATFDEVAHIPAGYSYVTQHDTRLNPEHPPLIKDLAGLPLLFQNLKFDTTKPFWTGSLPNMWDEGQWAAGRHLLYEAGNDPDSIIFWSRLPIVILSVLLGWFLFHWGKEIAGAAGGIFILVLYAFDPNILGHNHFVTTDIGVAAFLTFSFYYFLKFIKHPTWKNAAIGGLFLGLLLVSKFSSIVAVPVYGLVLFVYALAKNNPDLENNWKTRLKNLGGYILKSLAAFAVATVVIWCVYEINIFNMPKETFSQTIDFFFSADDTNLKASVTNQGLHALNENSLTRPLATYLFGPAWMFKRVSGGNGAYFMGQVGNGFTGYFPTVFALKETIPFLILSLFALAYTFKQAIASALSAVREKRIWIEFARFLRHSLVYYALFIFIILYAYLSISGGLNIGFRHLFPILPFAYILITKKVFEFLREKHAHTKSTAAIILAFLLCWQIITTVAAFPNYTSYFNESIGGSSNGYKYVTDSNTDWGQDLKRLKSYLDARPEIDKIKVDYFGGGNPQLVLGSKYVQWWDSMRPIQPGWYAISTNFLQGSIYDTKNKNPDTSYSWTLNYEPVDMIGKSIMIFHIETLQAE